METNDLNPDAPEAEPSASPEVDAIVRINGQLIGRLVDATWSYLPPTAELRRESYAKALVVKACELAGLDFEAVAKSLENLPPEIKNFDHQMDVDAATPELDTKFRYETPSHVLNLLRRIIDKAEEVEEVNISDLIIKNKYRWQIDGDTRRLAETIVKAMYINEHNTVAAEEVVEP